MLSNVVPSDSMWKPLKDDVYAANISDNWWKPFQNKACAFDAVAETYVTEYENRFTTVLMVSVLFQKHQWQLIKPHSEQYLSLQYCCKNVRDRVWKPLLYNTVSAVAKKAATVRENPSRKCFQGCCRNNNDSTWELPQNNTFSAVVPA